MRRYVQTFESFLSGALPYYAILDEQTGSYLYSGLNTRSREDVIDAGIEYLLGSVHEDDEISDDEIRSWSYEDKEKHLNTAELYIEQQFEPFPDEDYDDSDID